MLFHYLLNSFLLNILLKEHIALFPNLDYKNFILEAVLLNNLGYHFRRLWWPATTSVRTSGACLDYIYIYIFIVSWVASP